MIAKLVILIVKEVKNKLNRFTKGYRNKEVI